MKGGIAATFLLIGVMLAGCSDQAPQVVVEEEPEDLYLAGVVLTEALVPIPYAEITVAPDGLENVTNEIGEFRIGPVLPGDYVIKVQADGYAPTEVTATLSAWQEMELIKIRMPAVASNVPYHEVEQFLGYLECSAGFYVFTPGGQDLPCIGIIDLVSGVRVSWDEWNFHWEVSSPGLEGVLIEGFWENQATATHMGILLRNVAGAGSGVDAGGTNIDIQYASNTGTSPLRTWVIQGIENPGADSGALFQDPQNETMLYNLMILGRTDRSQQVSYHLWLQVEPELFVTKFYHQLGDETYTIANPQ